MTPTYSLLTNIIVYILLTNTILFAFYKAFKTNWPEQYFSLNNKSDYFLSISPIRLVLFRFLPPLVTFTMIAAILFDSASTNIILKVAVLSSLIHIFFTNFQALKKLLNGDNTLKRYVNTYAQVILQIVSMALVLGAAIASSFASKTEVVKAIKPTWTGLIDNIWSSVIIGIFIVFILDLYKNKDIDETEIIDASMKSIDKKVFDKISTVCEEKNANEVLVKSICVIENLQRPKWIRFFEHVKSFIFRKGSYGIMQFSSGKWISDDTSIELAVEKYFPNTVDVSTEDELREIIKKYNSNPDYVDLVLICMRRIDEDSIKYEYLG